MIKVFSITIMEIGKPLLTTSLAKRIKPDKIIKKDKQIKIHSKAKDNILGFSLLKINN